MESSVVSPKLLLLQALLLLFLAPVQQLQARELGGSAQPQHVGGGLPSVSVLVLPSDGGGGNDDDGAAVVVSPKLNALLPGAVSRRPGGLAPPAPQPGYRPKPGQERPPSQDVDSSPGVTGNRKLSPPPPPKANPSPHHRRGAALVRRRTCSARVLRDALARVMSLLLPELR